MNQRCLKINGDIFLKVTTRTWLEDLGYPPDFIQDNQSRSSYGVIRGLHYQKEPHAQTKLVRVTEGNIYDVAVDIREGSPTYGKWFGLEFSAENHLQLTDPQRICSWFFSAFSHVPLFFTNVILTTTRNLNPASALMIRILRLTGR